MKKTLSFLFVATCSMVISQLSSFEKTKNVANEQYLQSPVLAKRSTGTEPPLGGGGGGTHAPLSYEENLLKAYFDKLTTNFGSNDEGSCPFVAAEQLLSYYNTFLNDYIIPDNYESDLPVCSEKDFRSANESFGTKSISYSGYELPSHYWLFIQAHKNQSLHLELLSNYLDDNDESYLPAIPFFCYNFLYKTGRSKCIGYAATLMEVENCIVEYINEKTNLTPSSLGIQRETIVCPTDLVTLIVATVGTYIVGGPVGALLTCMAHPELIPLITFAIKNQLNNHSNQLKQRIKELVQSGTPVEVTACPTFENLSTKALHSFVVYGFDETTNSFLCNDGWGGSGYDLLTEDKYFYALEIMYLNPTLPHVHSNSYIYNDTEFCPCDKFEDVNEIEVPEITYLDECPTFTWNSYKDVKSYDFYNKSYQLSICDQNGFPIINKYGIKSNEYTLTPEEYNSVIVSINSDSFKVYLRLINGTQTDYLEDISLCSALCEMPNTFSTKVQIKPTDWYSKMNRIGGRKGNLRMNSVQTGSLAKGDFSASVTSYRAWKDGSWIVVQPKDLNNEESYIQMDFATPVYGFSCSFALRDLSEECGSITIQIKKADGNWVTKLNDLGQLPSVQGTRPIRTVFAEAKLVNMSQITLEPIYGMRIRNNSKKVGSQILAGALCIDDLVFATQQPAQSVMSFILNWNINYRKSCYPNNVPSSGNTNDPLIPIGPLDPIGIGTK